MFAEDLSLFFNSSDFAVAAVFRGTTIVKGILGSAYVEVNGVESSKPAFTCAFSDVEDVMHSDSLVIESIEYKIVAVKPDGTGIAVLVLELQ